MGNYNYLVTAGNVTQERFDKTLREILTTRFQGFLVVEPYFGDALRGWTIRHHKGNKLPVFQIWMDTQRTFEFDPRLHPINHFFESCVRQDLAKALKGKLFYDACGGRFGPEPEKYTTYKKYVVDTYDSSDPGGSIYSLREAERFRSVFPVDLLPWFE